MSRIYAANLRIVLPDPASIIVINVVALAVLKNVKLTCSENPEKTTSIREPLLVCFMAQYPCAGLVATL